jgi:hypothetical protein
VQNRPIFRRIDLFTLKHGIDPRPQTGLFSQLDKEPERFVRDAILRIIEVNAYGFHSETLTAVGIVREQITKVQSLEMLEVCFERFPGPTFRDWGEGPLF